MVTPANAQLIYDYCKKIVPYVPTLVKVIMNNSTVICAIEPCEDQVDLRVGHSPHIMTL